MEIHDPNYHLKLIEMCDCYLETDYATQIQKMAGGPSKDIDEDAVKYLALAIMYAVTEKAQKLSLKKKAENISVTVKSDGEKLSLRPPFPELFDRIIAIIRTILHLEDDKGAMPLSLGLRNGQLDVQVKLERSGDKESLKLKFPSFE